MTFEVKEPLLRVEDILGEAPVWDSIRARLYWVDIDGRRIHWYHPDTGTNSFRRFQHKISAIACTNDDSGLVAAIEEGFAFVSFDVLFSKSPKIAQGQILASVPLAPGEKRFNEGMADPAGRFLAGTMGLAHGTYDGRMFSLERGKMRSDPILERITCTNGMGWVEGGSKMYFTDSWDKTIDLFDYDVATGTMTNRQPFSTNLPDHHGWPDGLCLDSEGGVWSARWAAGKVLRLDSSGKVDIEINFPKAWNMTSCVFGGDDMDVLYVTSARSDIEADAPGDRQDGGSLFAVYNLGVRGVERFRYTM